MIAADIRPGDVAYIDTTTLPILVVDTRAADPRLPRTGQMVIRGHYWSHANRAWSTHETTVRVLPATPVHVTRTADPAAGQHQ